MVLRQKVFAGIVVAANVGVLSASSNVVELVARNRHVLLGRYSREHFFLIVAVLLASMVGFYIDWAPPAKYRRRWFQVIATLLFLVPSIAILDYVARVLTPQPYVMDEVAYHRPPNTSFDTIYDDRPLATRSYPNAPDGYGTVSCSYQVDATGYRNRLGRGRDGGTERRRDGGTLPGVVPLSFVGDRLEPGGELTESGRCDVLVLGDSFAEGSSVSDEHVWSARLGEMTQLRVINLGMSGYAPDNYLAALQRHGGSLSPKLVVCMIYEGNDFRRRDANVTKSLSKRFNDYVKRSPLRRMIDKLFVGLLGPVGADRQVTGMEILSWMPVAIPDTGGLRDSAAPKHYAFAPKQLLQNYQDIELFRAGSSWRHTSEVLAEIKKTCGELGAELLIAYAPTKAHVVLPLVRDQLPADDVRAFAALRQDGLPTADVFLSNLFTNFPGKETVVREWCRSRKVGFVSATDVLRQHAASGVQVYFTYDQHWTPEGHEAVAELLYQRLATRDE